MKTKQNDYKNIAYSFHLNTELKIDMNNYVKRYLSISVQK